MTLRDEQGDDGDRAGEIAEFAATPGETYDIRIRRWSGTQDVWFGIAWTVTGIDLIADHITITGTDLLGRR